MFSQVKSDLNSKTRTYQSELFKVKKYLHFRKRAHETILQF